MSNTHHHIVQNIRGMLAPFIGGSGAEVTAMPQDVSYGSHIVSHAEANSRYTRKIPKKNYEDLAKMVPISWL